MSDSVLTGGALLVAVVVLGTLLGCFLLALVLMGRGPRAVDPEPEPLDLWVPPGPPEP